MTKRLIVIACVTALLIAAAVVVALRKRRRPVPLPEAPVAQRPAEVRIKAVERKTETVGRGEVAAATGWRSTASRGRRWNAVPTGAVT